MKRRATWIFEAVLLSCVALTTGCATITGSETQNLSVQALDETGAGVTDAECKLTNDKGSWRVKPPAVAVVNRSAEDLVVQCNAEGQEPGNVKAISRANGGMAGNILFGGGIGAIIDHNKGTAYDYPSAIRVVFGTSRVIDKREERGDVTAMPSAPPPPVAPRAEADRPPSDTPVSMDDLKDLLPQASQ